MTIGIKEERAMQRFRKERKEFLATAQKLDITHGAEPLYGPDAERMAKGVAKYYEKKGAILKKYLE